MSDRQSAHPSEPLVLVLGHTGHGKSTFIQSLLSPEEAKKIEIGHNWRSCTTACHVWEAKLGHDKVYMVDTPGLNDSYHSDFDILAMIIGTIVSGEALGRKVKGIIYLIDISCRLGGLSRQHLNLLGSLCGSEAYKKIVFATTKWNADHAERERQLENQDSLFAEVLADFRSGGAECHSYFRDSDSARAIVMSLVGKPDTEFQFEKEMRYQKLKLLDTRIEQILKTILPGRHRTKPRDTERVLQENLEGSKDELREKLEGFIYPLLQREGSRNSSGIMRLSWKEVGELASRILTFALQIVSAGVAIAGLCA